MRVSADIAAEAQRLIAAATENGVLIRVAGGIAIAIRGSSSLPRQLRREYHDIDLVSQKGQSKLVSDFMQTMGYVANVRFNTVQGHRRLMFAETSHGHQVDVFVGSFEMCHVLPIAARLEMDAYTIPLAELLLTKLQIVQLNEKDRRDIIALLVDHDVGDSDDGSINARYVAQLCADDWGLWRTSRMNIERVRMAIDQYDLAATRRSLVDTRLDALWQRIEAEPKSLRWRLRGQLGDRLRWYEEPEEVR